MNRIHRVLWNAVKGCWVAANEKTGLKQARGHRAVKASVIAAATAAALAGFSAQAAQVTQEGVLTPDEGKTMIFVTNTDHLDLDISQTGISKDSFSILETPEAAFSSVADGVTVVHVAGNAHAKIQGQIDETFKNTDLVTWNTDNSQTGNLLIGGAAEQTKGSFGKIYVGVPDLTTLKTTQSGRLSISNADISIDQLFDMPAQTEQGVFIDSQSTVSVGTLLLSGYLENEGDLTIDSFSNPTQSNGQYRFNPGTIANTSKLTVTGNASGAFYLHNLGSAAEANFQNLTIDTGLYGTDHSILGRSENTGTIKVSDTFTLAGFSRWGNTADLFGMLSNAGNFTATEAVINGDLSNENAGQFTVTNDLTVAVNDKAEGREQYPDYKNRIINSGTFTVGGSMSLQGSVTVENQNGTMSAGSLTIGEGASMTVSGGKLIAGAASIADTLVIGSDASAEIAMGSDETAVISAGAAADVEGILTAGSLMNDGTVTVSGELHADRLENGSTIQAGSESGTLTVGMLVNNNAISIHNATVGQISQGELGSLSADSLTFSGGESAQTNAGTLSQGTISAGLLRLDSSVLTIESAATVSADTLTLNNGELVYGGSQTAPQFGALDVAQAGGVITLNDAALSFESVSNSNGLTVNYNGAGADLTTTQGKLSGATLNMNGRDWTFTQTGEDFGDNTVNLNDSDVVFSNGAALSNNALITVNAGSSVEAGTISFDENGTGGLVLNGGTLSTTLDQIFSSVQADDYLEGTNVSTGESVQIPLAGIQSVGAVKTELTGENGIAYKSGAFEFTDSGWTVNAVNSAAQQLSAAFSGFAQSESTLVFSGSAASGGDFTLDDAASLASDIVLSGTTVVNADPDTVHTVVIGSSAGQGEAALTQSAIGFQAVSGVDAVKVEDGHRLFLTGFDSASGSTQLIRPAAGSSTNKGVLDIAAGGTASLGSLDGSKAYGSVDEIISDGTLNVAAGADIFAGSVTLGSGSALAVGQDAVLTVGSSYSDEAGAQVTNDGTLQAAAGADGLTISAEVINNGTLTAGTQEEGRYGTLTTNGKFSNNGVIQASGLIANGEFTNTSELSLDTITASGEFFKNTGKIAVGTAEISSLTNEGSLEAEQSLTLHHAVNRGSVAAAVLTIDTHNPYAVENGFINEASGTIDAADTNAVLTGAKNTNAGKMSGSAGDFTFVQNETQSGFTDLTNSGSMAYSESMSFTAADGTTGMLYNKGSLETGVLTFKNVSLQNEGKVTADSVVYDGAHLNNSAEGVIETGTLQFLTSNGVFTNKGTVKVTGGNGSDPAFVLGETAKFVNEGTLETTSMELGADAEFEQAETGTVRTDALTVVGTSFDLGSGTWIVENEQGIQFVDENGEAVTSGIAMNITTGQEYAADASQITGTAYTVTKTLTFGTAAQGLAAQLADRSEALKSALENDSGVLVLGQAVTMGAGSAITLGSRPASNSSISMLAEPEEGEEGGAEAPDQPTQASGFYAAKDSVTVFTGEAFGADGTSSAISAAGAGLQATIESGAKAVLTGIQKSGTYTLASGFDFSSNLSNGDWIGGWAADDAEYVTIDNGSDLDWLIDVSYDAEANALKVNAVAPDVRTVYNFAVPDIANAALRLDASKGADVKFLQAVINNKDLSVAETEKVVNSVTQIAGSLGVAANVLSDASSLMDSVESRVGFAENQKDTGLWVKLEGGKYKADSLKLAGGMEAGYDADTYGFTMGADGEVQPGLRLGAAFSYLKGDADAAGDVLSGSNDYDTFGLQAYGAWDAAENVRVLGEIGWFHSSADLEQTIARANVRKASADVDTNAVTFGVRVEGKFDLAQAGGLSLIPHAGLRGLWLMNDDFDTTIDGEKAFKNNQDDTFTMQVPLGVTVQKAFSTASGWTVTPMADVTITPQFGDTDFETTVTGIGTGVSQGVTADMAGDVTGRLTLGIKASAQNMNFGAHYGFTAGDAGRQDHAFGLSFSYKF